LTRIYYKDAVAAVVVFDLTDRNTFDAALKWKEDIDSKVLLKNGDPIPVLLIGNKLDLVANEESPQCCDDAAITLIAKRSGFVGWCKTSAKDNSNIDAAFEAIAKKIADNHVKLEKLGYGQFESGDDLILLRGGSDNNGNQGQSKNRGNNKEKLASADDKMLRPRQKSSCC
jgi:GTPase SAR1 family protein